MSKAVESALREFAVPPESVPPAPTAHVLTMTEIEPPRAGPGDAAAPSAVAPGDLRAALRHVKATLTVCVGTAEITVGELLGAQEHHVLKLDRTVDQPVDVLLEGQVVARGVLVALDDHFGVRITQLPGGTDAAPAPGRG